LKFKLITPLLTVSFFLSCITIPPKVLTTAEVTAQKGLALRESPSIKAKEITLVPWAERVTLLGYDAKSVVIDGINSPWAKVRYKDKEGWVFGGYLIPVEPYEKIILAKENDINGYIGKVYTDYDKSIKFLSGSIIGGRFSVSYVKSGPNDILLFKESAARVGNFIKWKICDVFAVPSVPKNMRFFLPGACALNARTNVGGEIFALAKDDAGAECEYKAIRKAWVFDFAEKKVRETSPKNIMCKPECCGPGCM
jgi:hypothetical protein